MLDEEDAEFLANYKTKIPVVETIKDIEIDNINLYLHNILNSDVIIDGELLFSKGTKIDNDLILSLKQHNVKTVDIKEYKAVNFVFVGDNLKVEDENGKLITLAIIRKKLMRIQQEN
nr:hypothetical protein [Marinitoga lauensis]